MPRRAAYLRSIPRLLLAVFVTLSLLLSGANAATASPEEPEADAAAKRANALAAFPAVTTPDPVVRWMADQVSQDTLRLYMQDLTGETTPIIRGSPYRITTRNSNSGTPIQKATYYVGDHLTALGLSVEYHRWGLATAPNVIGQKTGETQPAEIYMITAHLDNMPETGTAPGADDNASGSVAVLIAADILSQFRWDCTLRFALWTGEEQGLLGSDKYAQRAKTNGETIAGVLNLDMIAWNTPDSPRDIDLHAKASQPRTVELANQMAGVIDVYEFDLIPEVRSDGTGSSDHASFWKHNFDAILGIEDYYPNEHDFHPDYHTPDDKLSTLDMGYFAEFVRAAVVEMPHMSACLVTGTVEGTATAAHDGSAIPAARITLTDGASRTYVLQGTLAGEYSAKAPPTTYTVSGSAYGYETVQTPGTVVAKDSVVEAGLSLTAAAPATTASKVELETGEVHLLWSHVSPNTAYRIHRGTAPYYMLSGDTAIATVDAAHEPAAGETLSFRDGNSDAGDVSTNHFYTVEPLNAAGVSAPANTTGEFDFVLVRP